ncbi:3-hydroxyacyl-CoA dehydrogenase NAD-binding domain-containing protein [Rhodococcus opacus]|uniref:3-hydroxyacyl-CoA dehydrogenase NAD-binding domain-containing protein n=1 Tax=Rhodococcus opacus TaxID=37919 RepID=UPI002236A489|nr:3-hydroxyacyl-CoA dehydrogenase NAD-binding domain-containing protein [Rhodococcus opacus]UZG59694.1 3-hydroxyacyl-CoA dehydrogenase NAD-binding domain-containing protein [Rhodococcus opacus]
MIVDIAVTESVAVLTIDHPPVNMGNTAMRTALADALDSVATRDGLTGVVLASAGTHFYAGSDISEFDRPMQAPQLPDVISRIENLDIPVVAALTGLALGGGLELALGCDLRVGDPTTVVGFPEVTLGILPGAGGTVRTARLVGVPSAIDLVASARRVTAEEAHALGLLDEVVPGHALLARAVERAAALGTKNRLVDRPAPESDEAAVAAARAAVSKRARPNVLAAVDMVCAGAALDGKDALRRERALFDELRVTDEASNLRYLFFAKRSATKAVRPRTPAPAIATIGIAGAGTMGASLARAFSARGYEVIVFDSNRAALERLADRDGIATTASGAGLGRADVIVDAVFEDMDVKKSLLRDVEPHLRDTAVIVSNTSYLDLNEMASALTVPERFAGLHFFNPPDRNPLVEIIRTTTTDDRTLAVLSALATRLEKTPIPAGIGDGFVANRVYADYRMQAEFLVEDGASPAEVDAALTDLGFAIGPFAVADMSGLDIAWARRKRLADTRDPRQRYVHIADRLCEAGRLGKKTGAGWYDYPDGAKRGVVDPRVDAIIEKARADAGVTARTVPGDEIRDRVLASMVCAAAALVETGVAERASDIDVALTEGFTFPARLGGPVRALARRNRDEVVSALAAAYRSCPVSFAIAEPAAAGEVPEAIEKILEAVR